MAGGGVLRQRPIDHGLGHPGPSAELPREKTSPAATGGESPGRGLKVCSLTMAKGRPRATVPGDGSRRWTRGLPVGTNSDTGPQGRRSRTSNSGSGPTTPSEGCGLDRCLAAQATRLGLRQSGRPVPCLEPRLVGLLGPMGTQDLERRQSHPVAGGVAST